MDCYFKLDNGAEVTLTVIENLEILNNPNLIVEEFGVEETLDVISDIKKGKQICYFGYSLVLKGVTLTENKLLVNNM